MRLHRREWPRHGEFLLDGLQLDFADAALDGTKRGPTRRIAELLDHGPHDEALPGAEIGLPTSIDIERTVSGVDDPPGPRHRLHLVDDEANRTANDLARGWAISSGGFGRGEWKFISAGHPVGLQLGSHMSAERSDYPAREAPLGQLERAFIDEFVRARGYDPLTLSELPEQERHALLKEASVYASAKLSEVESRAHLIHELHHTPRD